MLKIVPVDLSNRKEVTLFIDFPFKLYENCPQWVPPLLSSAYNDFNPDKHPFFQHSKVQLFLAVDKGKVLGRLAAMDNRRFNDFLGQKTAFFGYYDVVENLDVSQSLFKAAFLWAQERGLTRIIGPRALNSTDNCGILVDGFEHRAAMWLPYNYPYYDRYIQEAGFKKDTDHFSGYAPGDEPMPERLVRIAERIKERRGF